MEQSVKLRRDSAIEDEEGTLCSHPNALSILSFMDSPYYQKHLLNATKSLVSVKSTETHTSTFIFPQMLKNNGKKKKRLSILSQGGRAPEERVSIYSITECGRQLIKVHKISTDIAPCYCTTALTDWSGFFSVHQGSALTFTTHNMDPNVHRITDLQADTLLLSNHNNTNSKAGL
ncbi:hypothetical protein MUK42_12544 [Musa troglodytarum]|uniref:Uncharacterized protein n=1 Tax=Musa troglodytarum TaxID=320322 RepID=A0A9E7H0G1_9LILI|nr:hypothetical protein MUK42_12544 [Musa troglodytarum]